jgi:hypothetical protein
MSCWIATASADHVRRGRIEGIMQVCHGKGSPLARTKPGDGIAYYSPTVSYRGKDRLQAFTAIGRVTERAPYRPEMTAGFTPMRRDVEWLDAREAPIHPMLEKLDLTRGRRNWGGAFRFGLIRISEADFETISQAMAVPAATPSLA